MDPMAIAILFVGIVICFFGFPMIQSAIRVWGFFVVGVFAMWLSMGLFHIPGTLMQPSIQMGIAFLVGGVVGAILAKPLAIVLIFMSGTVLGVALGSYLYPLVTRNPEILILTIGLALVTGGMAVRFQEAVLITTTAFVGALMIVYSVQKLTYFETIPSLILFFVAGLFGAAMQFKSEHPDVA
jgi:hypothetical protein